ncbi:MAG: hypothetical protein HC881_01035 [Leptolyngbyaceae cyanobacterium SL_7_1]|nr:hypothetical protein [Leptolyngbyaceae cyanobacterium SL_7_1]
MVTTLQTLTFLFGTAFIFGFFSRDIKAIFPSPHPAPDGGTPPTPDVPPAPPQ